MEYELTYAKKNLCWAKLIRNCFLTFWSKPCNIYIEQKDLHQVKTRHSTNIKNII